MGLFWPIQTDNLLLTRTQNSHAHRITTLHTLQRTCAVGRVIKLDVINLNGDIPLLQTHLREQIRVPSRRQYITDSLATFTPFGRGTNQVSKIRPLFELLAGIIQPSLGAGRRTRPVRICRVCLGGSRRGPTSIISAPSLTICKAKRTARPLSV